MWTDGFLLLLPCLLNPRTMFLKRFCVGIIETNVGFVFLNCVSDMLLKPHHIETHIFIFAEKYHLYLIIYAKTMTHRLEFNVKHLNQGKDITKLQIMLTRKM